MYKMAHRTFYGDLLSEMEDYLNSFDNKIVSVSITPQTSTERNYNGGFYYSIKFVDIYVIYKED